MELNEYFSNYITSDSNLQINEEENNIIFGANGIGKSTIYRNIKEGQEIHCLDYDETMDSFKKSKKKLTIASNLIRIEAIEKEVVNKIKEQEIKSNLKIFSITKQGDCSDSLLEIFKEEKINEPIIITYEIFNELNLIKEDLKHEFLSIVKELDRINNLIEKEQDLEMLKNEYYHKFLEKADNLLVGDTKECPICGSSIENLKELIREKIADIEIEEDYVLKLFVNLDLNENKINEIIGKLSSIESKHIDDYLVLGGDFENKEVINQKFTEILNLELEKQALLLEKEMAYNNLLRYKDNIMNDITSRFPDVRFEFDDESHLIIINLEREVKTYSTGEINFILFNIKIYEFIASNKNLLIIDDILTSYDTVNQYSLIYLLVKIFSENDSKKFICFTHNLDTIKIIHNQHPSICKKYILEKVNGNLYLFDFNYDRFEKLINFKENIEFNSNYIKALGERDVEDVEDEMHEIFHYDAPKVLGDLTNDYFIDLINNFETFSEISNFDYYTFQSLLERKIELFLAIRVYIEYIIYMNCSEQKLNNLKGKVLGKKIDIMFPRRDEVSINGLTRSLLMSKKVMYNDSAHIENRMTMPFGYIFNLKADDIKKEINDIKSLVNSNN